MQIIVSGRHMDVSEETKSHVTHKLEKLTRFYDRVESIEAVLDRQNEVPIVEVIVNAEHGLRFVASDTAQDHYGALDMVINKLSTQLTRRKERIRNHKHQPKRSDQTLET